MDFRDWEDVIERNTKIQVQLIDDILDVSRIVSGKLRLEVHPFDLVDAINLGVNVVRVAAEARDIKLDLQLDPTLTHPLAYGQILERRSRYPARWKMKIFLPGPGIRSSDM